VLVVVSATFNTPISNIHYYVIYDPRGNSGIVEIRTIINLEEPDFIEIPVDIFNEVAEYTLINYTFSEGLFIAGLNMSEKRIIVFAYGSGELSILLYARSLIEELGVTAYSLLVNTENLRNFTLNVNLTLIFIGNYDVSIEAVKLKWNISKLDNTTCITLEGFGLGIVVLIPSIEETPEQPGQQTPWSTVIVVTALLSVTSGVVFYFLKKRKVIFTVERVDYLTDSSYRAIIRVLGDSGNKGLLQSEIVSKTGLSKSSVSRRVKKLEEEGFVFVKRSGKYNYVYLTDKGLEAYKKITKEGAR